MRREFRAQLFFEMVKKDDPQKNNGKARCNNRKDEQQRDEARVRNESHKHVMKTSNFIVLN